MDPLYDVCVIQGTHNYAYVIEGPPHWQVWGIEIVHSKAAMPWSLGHLGIAYVIGGVYLMRKLT